MLRLVALWISGLFACAMAGGMVAHYFYPWSGDIFGGLIGIAAFVCGRLWTTEKRKES
jgi:hypothetical protein